MSAPFYKNDIRELCQKQVAGLAMDAQVKACLRELTVNLSAETLDSEFSNLPGFVDALRASTCNQVRNAYL